MQKIVRRVYSQWNVDYRRNVTRNEPSGSNSAEPSRPTVAAGFGRNGTEAEVSIMVIVAWETDGDDVTRVPQMDEFEDRARGTAANEDTNAISVQD